MIKSEVIWFLEKNIRKKFYVWRVKKINKLNIMMMAIMKVMIKKDEETGNIMNEEKSHKETTIKK